MQLATALLSFLCIQKNYTCTLYPQAYNSLGNYEIMAHNSLLNTHKWDLIDNKIEQSLTIIPTIIDKHDDIIDNESDNH